MGWRRLWKQKINYDINLNVFLYKIICHDIILCFDHSTPEHLSTFDYNDVSLAEDRISTKGRSIKWI